MRTLGLCGFGEIVDDGRRWVRGWLVDGRGDLGSFPPLKIWYWHSAVKTSLEVHKDQEEDRSSKNN